MDTFRESINIIENRRHIAQQNDKNIVKVFCVIKEYLKCRKDHSHTDAEYRKEQNRVQQSKEPKRKTHNINGDKNEVNKGIEQEAEQEALMQCVSKLPEREREIMELRFGLNGGTEHTQKEVADILNISQSYISRLEKKILLKLRHDIEKVTM